jgi:two-component system cell cycle response regulator DivK
VSQSKSVLIVEPSAEEREVLRTVLASRGLVIFEADEAQAGLELARQHQPDVILLDLEAESEAAAWPEQFDAASPGHPPSLIVLGKARRHRSLPAGQVISKPYHFAPLVQKIEQLAKAA